MATVEIYSIEKKKVGTVDLDPAVFDVEVREHLFHELVRAQRAAKRAGTAKTKERGEVRGSQAKSRPQKGTGRARQGNGKAPHFVGGGVAHGPRPRSYALKVNKQTRRAALCAALSRRQQEGHLIVLDNIDLTEIKTKTVVGLLGRFEIKKTLIVDAENPNLAKSTQNLSDSNFIPVDGLNVFDILRHDHLMLTTGAVESIVGRLTS
jgi:large subunit ribosomal protein L4